MLSELYINQNLLKFNTRTLWKTQNILRPCPYIEISTGCIIVITSPEDSSELRREGKAELEQARYRPPRGRLFFCSTRSGRKKNRVCREGASPLYFFGEFPASEDTRRQGRTQRRKERGCAPLVSFLDFPPLNLPSRPSVFILRSTHRFVSFSPFTRHSLIPTIFACISASVSFCDFFHPFAKLLASNLPFFFRFILSMYHTYIFASLIVPATILRLSFVYFFWLSFDRYLKERLVLNLWLDNLRF